MKAKLFVPTRGYVWHETATLLEGYHPTYMRNKLSVADCRNRIVREFLQSDAELLFMCDDDVLTPEGALELMSNVLLDAPYDILGAAVPVGKFPAHEMFLNAFTLTPEGKYMTVKLPENGHMEVDAVGTGLIAIRRAVLEHPDLKAPFQQRLDEDGIIQVGQDLEFCHRAQQAGFTIGITTQVLCDHYISAHANAIQYAYKGDHLTVVGEQSHDLEPAVKE